MISKRPEQRNFFHLKYFDPCLSIGFWKKNSIHASKAKDIHGHFSLQILKPKNVSRKSNLCSIKPKQTISASLWIIFIFWNERRQNKIWKDFQNFLSKNIVLIRGSWWDYFMRGWLGILRLSY